MKLTDENKELWFLTGAQTLYGEEALRQVDLHSKHVVDALNAASSVPCTIRYCGTVKSTEEIEGKFQEANSSAQCVGVILWMHTFSPAKMWIRGLKLLNKPILHLHTQFYREIPWDQIDMDFMNLNQSAHGDREFGHIMTRLRKPRKVVTGFWEDADVQERVAVWTRACLAWDDLKRLRVIRFGDQMNDVSVTDGDRVSAEETLGFRVEYCPVGELCQTTNQVSEADVDDLMAQYHEAYDFAPNCDTGGAQSEQVRHAARLELGVRRTLAQWNGLAFTTNFDDLYGLNQLPGLAAQRLMYDGYGFGAEGDWKTAALVRAMKVMSDGLPGGTSFLEDYVYHFSGAGAILQAHMLEVCPSIAESKPRMEVHPLGIGGKADPARLVFTARPASGVAATIVDLGNRFRMIVNEVDCIRPPAELPKLPVARAFWTPRPDLKTSATSWILAGGTHHTSFSSAITRECLEDFAEIAQIELAIIDSDTTVSSFKRELRCNEAFYN
ncbi:MAG: L-arabinose isomerase [Planctomycetia bacterium]|nr:L-arabinose isomerase [Planctomycetia bacterium]